MEFRILGPLEVVDSGRRVSIGAPRERALLLLLLLNANEVVSRDRLIDELWGEEPPPSAVSVLQTYVSHLRRALPADRLITRPPGYLVAVRVDELDLRRFERLVGQAEAASDRGDPATAAQVLREALGLWRGEALADFAYEPFAQPAIRRLEELRLAALERKIDADLALGGRGDTVPELEELVHRHPLRERFREQLMLALYRSGRQADALDAYRDARQALRDGLGLDPGHALQELESAILRQDPSLTAPRGAEFVANAAEPPARSLLVVAGADDLAALLSVAEPLAGTPPRELIVVRLLTEATSPAAATALLSAQRDQLVAKGLPVRVAAYTSECPAREVVQLATEQDVDLVLLDASPGLLEERVLPPDLAAVLGLVPCDVAVLVGGALGPERARPVVVPFGGAEHEWAALEVGAWTAHALGTTLRLVGTAASPLKGRRDASRLLGRVSLVVQAAVGIVCEPVLVRGEARGMLDAASDALLLVIGLSGRWPGEGIGSVRVELASGVRAPTLLVRKGLRPGGLAPKESLTRFTWSLGG